MRSSAEKALEELVPLVRTLRQAAIRALMAKFKPGVIMADILVFPTDANADADFERPEDHFLLDEGLELLSDFRAIEDRQVRDSLRTLVKSLAIASRKVVVSGC